MVIGISLVIWIFLVVLAVSAGKEEGRLLQRMSTRLYKKLLVSGKFKQTQGCGEGQVRSTLICLNPGRSPTQLVTGYYTEKLKLVLIILAAGSLAACCMDGLGGDSEVLVSQGIVYRGSITETIVLQAEGGKPEVDGAEISLEVAPREWTREEAGQKAEELKLQLEKMIPGENSSLGEVYTSLCLPNQVEGYPFWIDWDSSNRYLLDGEGKVFAEELDEPAKVILYGCVGYGEMEWRFQWDVVVYPPQRRPEEIVLGELTEDIRRAAEENRYEESFSLPDSAGGENLVWKKKEEKNGWIMLLLVFCAAAAVYYMKDRDLQKELQQRREMIRQEYPVLVSKYALYLGAGLTIRGSFVKIYRDYMEKMNDKRESMHPLYEEMMYACNELQAGISESRVYEEFGRRTGVQEYTKLCTLLNQNLKKGNSALIQRLKEECEEALAETIRYRKRRGEEAGTKLLLPMVMMLLMVLVMILLPAFSDLGI